jgi:hypothetical protein
MYQSYLASIQVDQPAEKMRVVGPSYRGTRHERMRTWISWAGHVYVRDPQDTSTMPLVLLITIN